MCRYISLACLLFVFFYSCTKSNSGSGSTPPPPPPPPPGGTGTGITITNVSPLTPYYGDVITVTGTGFDADMTKDTVTFVNSSDGTDFIPLYGVSNMRFKIISATTTQIKFVTDSNFLIPFSLPQPVAVHVSSPAKTGFTKNILSFKRNLTFGVTATDPGPNPGCLAIYDGDSVFLSGEGLYPPLTVTINGISTNITADANSTTSARGFLPLNFFGSTRQILCADDKLYAIKVVNGDGRTFSNSRYCFEGPNSAVFQPFPIGLSYSLSATSTAQVNLTGYALRDDYNMELTSRDVANGAVYTEYLAVPVPAGFPNQSSFDIDLTSFPKPTTSQGSVVNYILRVGSTTDNVIGLSTAFTIFP